MALKLSVARQWLTDMRAATLLENFNYQQWIAVEYHAYSCACRLLSEGKILKLLLDPTSKPHLVENTYPTALPNSFLAVVTDLDPDIPSDRQRVELSITFDCLVGKKGPSQIQTPIVCHGFRQGSPKESDPGGLVCQVGKGSSKCAAKSVIRPRGRI